MDPLQKLWELYDGMNVVEKPPLEQEMPSAMGTPQKGDYEHPVIQQRRQVDDLRGQGMSDADAHQEVYGEVDLANPESKGQLASTLHRIQTDDDKRGIQLDKNAVFKSLLARDKEESETQDVTSQDLKTPMAQEVPDEKQVDNQTEEWYNFDVAYIQQFGR